MVTQLANAFEQGVLSSGDKVCLMVETSEETTRPFVRLKITTGSAPLQLENLSLF